MTLETLIKQLQDIVKNDPKAKYAEVKMAQYSDIETDYFGRVNISNARHAYRDLVIIE